MSKIVLGLDPGIADTGYGIIEEEKGFIKCLDYGSIKTSSTEEFSVRLEQLFNLLDKIIKKHKPDVVGIEQLFFNKNVKTALIVGQARGVILLAIKKNKINCLEFSPSQVKQGITSYGKATKEQVQKMVKLVLKLDKTPQPDDAADALAIAICALNNKNLCQKN